MSHERKSARASGLVRPTTSKVTSPADAAPQKPRTSLALARDPPDLG
jgi:hypothetical protein